MLIFQTGICLQYTCKDEAKQLQIPEACKYIPALLRGMVHPQPVTIEISIIVI